MGGEDNPVPAKTFLMLRIALFLDFDGTLAPIRKNPAKAKLSARMSEALKSISIHNNIFVAIISGRKLSDLKKLLPLKKAVFAGNHGFEIVHGSKKWVHPSARKAVGNLRDIYRELCKAVNVRGSFIENKVYTLSLHYRNVPPGNVKKMEGAFLKAMKGHKAMFIITHGKKVFEVRPRVNWDKGKAVKWIISKNKLGRYFPIYIGDDDTDEDAYKIVNRKGLTISLSKGNTHAHYRFRSIRSVLGFINKLKHAMIEYGKTSAIEMMRTKGCRYDK